MQSTNRIIMIKPSSFFYNKQTAEDNKYQNKPNLEEDIVQSIALKEFNVMVERLRKHGINVEVFNDTPEPFTPDSIFPNNWFSTHDGKLILYPMFAENRRLEINKFKDKLIDLYKPTEIIDLTHYTNDNKFLESTGAMVLDRVNKIIYSSLSQRADEELVEKISKEIGFDYIVFHSSQHGHPIYHTNVMMAITTNFAFVASDLIEDNKELVMENLKKTHQVIELSGDQIIHFAGNVLELSGKDGEFIMMSDSAYRVLTSEQKETIKSKTKIVHTDVSTIEKIGGGSVRCMMAEIF